jgi:hypothetical protein
MSDGPHLMTWVTRETKARFAAVARHQGLSNSALLKRLVELMLQSASAAEVATLATTGRAGLAPDGATRRRRASMGDRWIVGRSDTVPDAAYYMLT